MKYNIDFEREERRGFPEAIFCEGKELKEIIEIIGAMLNKKINVIATRVKEDVYEKVKEKFSDALYNKDARCITLKVIEKEKKGKVCIVTGGTADIPVAEEAKVSAEFYGCNVETIYDIGVAGIHRLFDNLDRIKDADIVIVVAGMEGALASVVTGLIDIPVIGVPTSIGYGSSMNGLSALLSMLNSCSPGLSIMNIDNGFGAGYNAALIIRKIYLQSKSI